MSEETKEVKISIPEGYEIDTEKSTFTNIVFKKKCTSWFERLKQRCEDAYISGYMLSETFVRNCFKNPLDICIFATKKQAKRAKAYAIITQIIANDSRFGGEITDEEWRNSDTWKYVLCRFGNRICKDSRTTWCAPIAFHTAEQRNLFLKENEQLLKDYFMID
jgi:hypothetical protein